MKQDNNKKSISVRLDENMEHMISELKETLPLNTSSIMRLALITFYRNQMKNNDINE
ncbi:hypothetical protein [uncultured Methanobrevibacter sp.]|uniref:hypothetical protein n=1 Tax=uncultured Methanobrevibacter sp. TaxID=253161 RepID=UPI0025EEA0DF|nr:hypothetical protein [uncultured Methanobrevibacter sp.]